MEKNTKILHRSALCVVWLCIICIVVISVGLGFEGLHECTGESCFICAVISARESIRNGLIFLTCLFGMFLFNQAFLKCLDYTRSSRVCLYTLVGLKVKLSN